MRFFGAKCRESPSGVRFQTGPDDFPLRIMIIHEREDRHGGCIETPPPRPLDGSVAGLPVGAWSTRAWTEDGEITSQWTATVEKELYRWFASSRGILAIGLSLAGLAYLVAPTLGQQANSKMAWYAKRRARRPARPPAPDRTGYRHGRYRARFQELRKGQGVEQGIQRRALGPEE